jgi:hypothetical protein
VIGLDELRHVAAWLRDLESQVAPGRTIARFTVEMAEGDPIVEVDAAPMHEWWGALADWFEHAAEDFGGDEAHTAHAVAVAEPIYAALTEGGEAARVAPPNQSVDLPGAVLREPEGGGADA